MTTEPSPPVTEPVPPLDADKLERIARLRAQRAASTPPPDPDRSRAGRRRRPHPARASRIAATGFGVSLMFGLVAAYGLQANADTGPALIEAPVADRPIVVNVQLVTPDGRLTASASTTTQAPVALVADASSQLPAAATPAQPQVRVLAAPPVQVVAPAQAGPVAQTAPPAQAAAPVQARTNGSR